MRAVADLPPAAAFAYVACVYAGRAVVIFSTADVGTDLIMQREPSRLAGDPCDAGDQLEGA